MPATTSALMALRFSGRLMVIQNACPRFSRITLLVSVIVPLALFAMDWRTFAAGWPWTASGNSATRMRVRGLLLRPNGEARPQTFLKFSAPAGVNVAVRPIEGERREKHDLCHFDDPDPSRRPRQPFGSARRDNYAEGGS